MFQHQFQCKVQSNTSHVRSNRQLASDFSEFVVVMTSHKMTELHFPQSGALGPAVFGGKGAAFGKPALVLRLDGRTDLTLQDDALFLLPGAGHGDGREQGLGVGMHSLFRMAMQRVCSRVL